MVLELGGMCLDAPLLGRRERGDEKEEREAQLGQLTLFSIYYIP
jgi:hypothetical protein